MVRIKKYNDFINESSFSSSGLSDDNDNDNDKKSDLKMKNFCSWDEISIKKGFFDKKNITVFYSPIKNTIVSISPSYDKFPFKNGDKKEDVQNWIKSNAKVDLIDFHIKRFNKRKF